MPPTQKGCTCHTQGGGHQFCVSANCLPSPLAGLEPAQGQALGRQARPHLCLALMCICRPLRLEARCPHSSHTNSFSPRCLKASCSCSSVRDRKHLAQVGHCRAEGAGPGEGRAGLLWEPHPHPRPSEQLWPQHQSVPGTYSVRFGGSMQLDHVTLQVLFLHELLGAGGALGNRPTVNRAACTHDPSHPRAMKGRDPRAWSSPRCQESPCPGVMHALAKSPCRTCRDAKPALRGKRKGPKKGQWPCPKV